MKPLLLLKNIRFYILLLSLSLSIVVFIFFKFNSTPNEPFEHNLTHTYALIAAFYLYLALLIGPFCYNFKTKFNSKIIKARRAIGVSAFYFATLHLTYGFLFVLGGFTGLFASEWKYILAVCLSFTGYIVLFFMAATSFDFMIKLMTFKRWKLLHRFIYIGSFFILIHSLIIGEHFQLNNPNWISATFTILILFLLHLEGKRIIANLKTQLAKTETEDK